jgi:4-O-beta-D-mannosyl-D-glucose phosphorylase
MRYVLHLFLCDLNDPRNLINSAGGYFMAPEGRDEWEMCRMYCSQTAGRHAQNGSSDTRTHVATSTVGKLLDYVLNSPEDGVWSSVRVRQRCELIRNNERLKSRRKMNSTGVADSESGCTNENQTVGMLPDIVVPRCCPSKH